MDDRVLVDAGTVGGALSVAEQIEIEHALITHSHLDHTVGLAFLTDTLAMVAPDRRVTVASISPVIRVAPESRLQRRDLARLHQYPVRGGSRARVPNPDRRASRPVWEGSG